MKTEKFTGKGFEKSKEQTRKKSGKPVKFGDYLKCVGILDDENLVKNKLIQITGLSLEFKSGEELIYLFKEHLSDQYEEPNWFGIFAYSIDMSIEHKKRDGRGRPISMEHFKKELNTKQKKLLSYLTDCGDKFTTTEFKITMIDLSALTNMTDIEFALFNKVNEYMVIRGDEKHVPLTLEEAEELNDEGYTWVGHTHPGTSRNALIASDGDHRVLKKFTKQEKSVIYNAVGQFELFEKD